MNSENNKRLCIFSHYYKGNFIPFYVLVYIKELKKYFDEFIVVTNERPISNKDEILDSVTTIMTVKNEGYDFGMFFKAFNTIDFQRYEQIACVNDSNIVFGSLDFLFNWGNKQNTDFWGLVDSYQKPKHSEHQRFYHIQSHFLVFNRNAIEILPGYLSQIDLQNILQENDKKQLRKKVIEIWEIGISQYLLKNRLTCKTYINSKEYSNAFYNGDNVNVTIKLYENIVRLGIPVLKRRVIDKRNWYSIFSKRLSWKKLILKYADKNFQPERLIVDLKQIKDRA